MREQKKRQFEFTVIAGSLKGRRIHAPDLGVTRPPLSRLRKSIFDFLNPYLPDARYLDLFSGTGSYLFEAVSRGVSSAIGVDLEMALVQSINDHARRFEVDTRLRCLHADVLKVLPSLTGTYGQFDIVMIAPPQYKGIVNQTLVQVRRAKAVHTDSLVICQHDSNETEQIDINGFSIDQRRKYGNTTYTILKLLCTGV